VSSRLACVVGFCMELKHDGGDSLALSAADPLSHTHVHHHEILSRELITGCNLVKVSSKSERCLLKHGQTALSS
jgi:hypothetical protein